MLHWQVTCGFLSVERFIRKENEMKRLILFLLFTTSLYGQAPTQIKQILPGTPSVQLRWDYIDANLPQIDTFVAQRTNFSTTVTITDQYSVETAIPKMQMPCQSTYALPTTTAGQRAFVRMVARKQGLADSTPSNVVQIDIVPTPPAPSNLNIARFTEVEYTKQNVGGIQLWTITSLL